MAYNGQTSPATRRASQVTWVTQPTRTYPVNTGKPARTITPIAGGAPAASELTNGKAANPEAAMTPAQMQAEIARLRSENAALQVRNGLKLGVGEKGGISLYGFSGQFPVTMFGNQWRVLLSHAAGITAVLDELEPYVKHDKTEEYTRPDAVLAHDAKGQVITDDKGIARPKMFPVT